MSLYFILLISSIAVPFILSFDKRVQYYKQWKYLLPSILIVAAVFIICDVFLTHIGVWGFNPTYHSNLIVLGLPIEEMLFFVFIPYASLFIHETKLEYFPKFKLNLKHTKIIGLVFILLCIIVAVLNLNKWYTAYIGIQTALVFVYATIKEQKLLATFIPSFLVMLIPFIVVNGILTGSFINNEVVWYNNSENLGIRLFTIPLEDFFYAFSLIFMVQLLKEKFK